MSNTEQVVKSANRTLVNRLDQMRKSAVAKAAIDRVIEVLKINQRTESYNRFNPVSVVFSETFSPLEESSIRFTRVKKIEYDNIWGTIFGVISEHYKDSPFYISDGLIDTSETRYIFDETGLVGSMVLKSTIQVGEVKVSGTLQFNKLLSERLPAVLDLEEDIHVRRLVLGHGNSITTSVKLLPKRRHIQDQKAFWPYLDDTPIESSDKYMRSNASVFLLYGIPGTGKTQYLHEMIRRHKPSNVYLADSQEIFAHPGFLSFIHTMPEGSWLITEDSIDMVRKRDNGNSLMDGILNATEGLCSSDIKFLISTNLTSMKEVDDALVRPGRTFDAIHFNKLTEDQGNAARASVDLPAVDFAGYGDMTLAEALNWNVSLMETIKEGKSFGFGS